MNISPNLQALIERCSNLWSAEAEVFSTYWDSPIRSTATDRSWLFRQIYKELLDGVEPNLQQIQEGFIHLQSGSDRDAFRLCVSVMQEEFEHYAGFVSLYESLIDDGQPCPDPATLRRDGAWPENDALMALRVRHREQYGMLGLRAQRFTEGGYCTLFSEGMKLKDRGGFDSRIAAVCQTIYADEFRHMLSGIADIAVSSATLSKAEWETLEMLAVEQLRQRVRMRNAQFSHPVGPDRVQAMLAGACEPLAFDYARAFRAVDE